MGLQETSPWLPTEPQLAEFEPWLLSPLSPPPQCSVSGLWGGATWHPGCERGWRSQEGEAAFLRTQQSRRPAPAANLHTS